MNRVKNENYLLGIRAAALCAMAFTVVSASAESPYISITGSAWRLALGDVRGDGTKQIVVGLYHGAVSCIDPARSRVLWEQPLGGFPFRASGDDVFLQTVRLAPDTYRLYLIDPGWLDPAVRRVRVRIQLSGDFVVRDLLTAQDVPVADREFAVEVPAGALRILEASPQPKSSQEKQP